MIDLVATYTRGLLRFGRGRLEEAYEALSAAESVRQRLSKNILTVDPRVQLIEVQVRLGQTAAAAAALAELSSEERDRAEMRLAAAAVHLGEGDPEHALAVLRPAIERSAPTIHPRTASMDALLFAAAAHNDMGDIRAVEESLERALDIANADGLILPFAMAPVRPLLERHPRHKTAHATLLSEILDLTRRIGPAIGRGSPAAGGAQRGGAPCGQVPAEQPEGAGDRGRAVRLPQHRPNPHATHLFQARRAQPERSRRPCA